MVKAYVIGIISNCTLGVYLKPYENSIPNEEFVFIPEDSEVLIDLENSTESHYKICNAAGMEGYCPKEYVEFKRVKEDKQNV